MTINPLHDYLDQPCDYHKISNHPFFQEPYTIYHILVDNNVTMTDEIIIILCIKVASSFVIYGSYENMYSIIANNPKWITSEIICEFTYYKPSNSCIRRCIYDLFETKEKIEERKKCIEVWDNYSDKICFGNRVEKYFPRTCNNEHVARFIDVCNNLLNGTYSIITPNY
jgi:hypothetical protein